MNRIYKLIITLATVLLLPFVALAEPNAYLNYKSGTPALISAPNYNLNIGTQGTGVIKLFYNGSVVEQISSSRLSTIKPVYGSLTALDASVTTATTAQPLLAIVGSSGVQSHLALVQEVASTQGADIIAMKTRAALGTTAASTIVASGDDILRITAMGANGTGYDNAARISFKSDGTPGATNDMPGAIFFYTTPDNSGTLTQAMKIDSAQLVTLAGGLKSTATNLGWAVRAGANTACNTTCTAAHGCLFGYDIGTTALVDCSSALADSCVCSF